MKFIEGYHRYILTNDVLTLLRSDFSYKTWIFIRHRPGTGTISPTKNDSGKSLTFVHCNQEIKALPPFKFQTGEFKFSFGLHDEVGALDRGQPVDDRGCHWKCVLSTSTILSFGGLHHQI